MPQRKGPGTLGEVPGSLEKEREMGKNAGRTYSRGRPLCFQKT